jgi:hypothetical protein
MNIFFLDKDPKKCAVYHNNKHVIKMILETCQLLSTAHQVISETLPKLNIESSDTDIIMRPSYINHPCNIWTRESLDNYLWLAELGWELCKEYTYRYGKIHKRQDTMVFLLDNWPKHLPHDGFTQPKQAMPKECKKEDSVEAYREYYRQEKRHLASWKKRIVPFWYK